MSLRKLAVNQTAYLKIGLFGFSGSGKTFTASNFGIGACKLYGKKTASFFDTETGSDFVINKFKKEGIDLYAHKGRSFIDLIAYIKESEKAGDGVLIIDSITHVWMDLIESYKKKLNRKWGLQIQDWGVVKPIWREFTDLYLNAKLNIIICGRAGYDYDTTTNEQTGKKEMVKGDTKMKAESDFGFEPSLLIEMERINKPDGKKGYINRGTILKDRSDTMNGSEIDYPTFESIKSFVDFLNIGGDHVGIDAARDSQSIFRPDNEESRKSRNIAIENLKNLCLKIGLGGTAEKVKKEKIALFEEVFGTAAWTAIESKDAIDINCGIAKIEEKYGLRVVPEGRDDAGGL